MPQSRRRPALIDKIPDQAAPYAETVLHVINEDGTIW
jgi:hypothetical protein